MDAHDYLENRIRQEIAECIALGNTISLSAECRKMIEDYKRDYVIKYEGIGLHSHIAYYLFDIDSISTKGK